jgi:hypothetical protein
MRAFSSFFNVQHKSVQKDGKLHFSKRKVGLKQIGQQKDTDGRPDASEVLPRMHLQRCLELVPLWYCACRTNGPLRNFSLRFPYVYPEPVLANDRSASDDGAKPCGTIPPWPSTGRAAAETSSTKIATSACGNNSFSSFEFSRS